VSKPVTALLPFFGGNRTLAPHVGAQLAGVSFVAIPFAGGLSEVRCITARTLLVGDLHKHVIALASVVAHPQMGPQLIRRLRRWVCHEAAMEAAQARCVGYERDGPPADLVQWAEDYFAASWLARSGMAGTAKEFDASFAVRYDAGGGDPAKRFYSAVDGLRDLRRTLQRCTFVVRDAFDLLADLKDDPETGVYLDPPWPQDGDKYRHRFTDAQQRQLAKALARFQKARVVIRYGDHPLIRELYAGPRWKWLHLDGRTANRREKGSKAEVLILNGELNTHGG
jgi:DNA adenine methylase